MNFGTRKIEGLYAPLKLWFRKGQTSAQAYANSSFRFISKAFARYKMVFKWAVFLLFFMLVMLFGPRWVQPVLFSAMLPETTPASVIDEGELADEQKKMQKQISLVDKKLSKLQPASYYLVINSTANEFFLYNADKLVKTGKCSTGSYVHLQGEGNQKWMFKTPKGELRIKGKTTSPVWKKPDWVFAEEGQPIPSANDPSRFEYGILGDYALSLGNGYLIHGTLYKRFLGMPVTHGCIRLNDEDLELVYQALPIGGKVLIY